MTGTPGPGSDTEIDIRRAAPHELDVIAKLQGDRNGPECDGLIRGLWTADGIGPDLFTVAVDGGAVVSSLCLMPLTLHLEGVEIPAGQPEFVATLPTHEHRGLVRRQMDLVHQWSQERGDLTQVIGGIPYFYRRFGYEYAVAIPRMRVRLPGDAPEMPDEWQVRRARPADVPAVMALEADVQQLSALTSSRSAWWWQWLIEHDDDIEDNYTLFVAERGGEVLGSAFLGDGPPGLDAKVTALHQIAGRHPDALRALIAQAATTGRPIAMYERLGLASTAYAESQRHPRRYGLYVRVADPVALLDHLRPVLSGRLARSAFAGARGTLLLSTYTRSIHLHYEDEAVVGIETGPPEQDPAGKGGAGVPPDLMATLIYGRYGAKALGERHDDVRLGRAADLMEVLFPAVTSDIVFCL